MMGLLAFALESALVAAIVAVGASLIVRALLPLLEASLLGRAPSLRADLILLLASLPAAAAIAAVLSASAPSLFAALSGVGDHCASHGHHLHFCVLHAGALRPALAALGAGALAVIVSRGVLRLLELRRTRNRLRELEQLGCVHGGVFPLVEIPGSALLLHAAGVFRRRIFLSAEFRSAFTPSELAGALAHEEGHLRRRDPLAHVALLLCGLFMPPSFCRAFRMAWKLASEEACDAHAAATVGDASCVAEALVKTAALQQRSHRALQTPAFGEVALERRIRLLLQGLPRESSRASASAYGFMMTGLASLGFLGLALFYASDVHHAVETVLHRLS